MDPLRYWGVRVFGTGSPTYNLVYDYTGHVGIVTEANLRLVERADVSDANWLDAGASLNEGANTLTITGATGTEYALASTSDALPVELVSFTGQVLSNDLIRLDWKTESEVNNYGFEIQRSIIYGHNHSSDSWQKAGFVEGHGNTNSPKEYIFTENKPAGASSVLYRLKQIDNDGQFQYSSEVEVTFSPDEFVLYQNYPNPFNPSTTIKYSLVEESIVSIKLFDILGSEIRTLVSEKQSAGNYEFEFNAGDIASGLYIYKMQAGNFIDTKKMMILK